MSNVQLRRLQRRLGNGGGHPTSPGGLYLPQGAYTPQAEQDNLRNRLAEQVLLELTGEICWSDDDKDEDGALQRAQAEKGARVAAYAALAAAEIIYPDVEEAGALGQKPPAAVLEGAESVTGRAFTGWDATRQPGEVVVDGAQSVARRAGGTLAVGED